MTSRNHKPARRRHTSGGRRTQTETLTLTVDALGAQGDGLARHGERRVFLPGALPGEQVRATVPLTKGGDLRGTVETVLTPAPDRVPPPCPHFGRCGGCTLQHLAPEALGAWKRDSILQSLRHRGLGETPVDPGVAIPPGRRRRATLGWVRTVQGILLGFHGSATHHLEDLRECALLTPPLAALVTATSPLRALLASLTSSGDRGQVVVTETDTGLDLTLELPNAPDLAGRERLAAFAVDTDVARLGLTLSETGTWEPVAARRPPVIHFADVPVMLPPLAFLQPSRDGEAAITAAILSRLPEGAPVSPPAQPLKVLDLFAGLGTFSLPLARRGLTVHAVDGAADAVAVLAAAPSAHPGRVTTGVRDLARNPVTGTNLSETDVVVFDPPRAGARDQAEALASDGPSCIIAVSCNPATFARDARLLVDGGYRLETVTPIDQFPWSAHVELVARLTRADSSIASIS